MLNMVFQWFSNVDQTWSMTIGKFGTVGMKPRFIGPLNPQWFNIFSQGNSEPASHATVAVKSSSILGTHLNPILMVIHPMVSHYTRHEIALKWLFRTTNHQWRLAPLHSNSHCIPIIHPLYRPICSHHCEPVIHTYTYTRTIVRIIYVYLYIYINSYIYIYMCVCVYIFPIK